MLPYRCNRKSTPLSAQRSTLHLRRNWMVQLLPPLFSNIFNNTLSNSIPLGTLPEVSGKSLENVYYIIIIIPGSVALRWNLKLDHLHKNSIEATTKKKRSGNMIKLFVMLTLMRGGEMLEGMVCNDKDTILYRLQDEVKSRR